MNDPARTQRLCEEILERAMREPGVAAIVAAYEATEHAESGATLPQFVATTTTNTTSRG